jgi:hypothetical protein
MNIVEEIERLRVVVPRQPVMVSAGPRDQRAIELYRDRSLKDVGAILNCDPETVRKILIRHGVEIRPASKNMRPHSGHNIGLTWRRKKAD